MDTLHKEAWSVDEVGLWLKELGLGAYAETFKSQLVNGRALEQLSVSDLEGLGMAMGHRHFLMAEIWRHNPGRCAVLPESLASVMMMEDMEAALEEVADIPDDFDLLDNTVYKDSANREVIVPAYLTIGVHALRGMNTDACEFGCDFGFQLRLKTAGLPRAALDHIIANIKFMINNQVHSGDSREMSMDAENSTTQVSIAGHFRGDKLMMFAGESETNFEMWRAFPFDRPSLILRLELLPVHLPHPVRERPWVVYFQMHETEHPASMVTFGVGADQMPSFDVARSLTELHLLPSAPLSFTGLADETARSAATLDYDGGGGGDLSSRGFSTLSSALSVGGGGGGGGGGAGTELVALGGGGRGSPITVATAAAAGAGAAGTGPTKRGSAFLSSLFSRNQSKSNSSAGE